MRIQCEEKMVQLRQRGSLGPVMRIRENVEIAFACVTFLWTVYFVDLFLPFDLRSYGIRPRSIEGLFGLIASPFLHSSLGHLLSNSIPLAALLSISLTYSRKLTLQVVFTSALIGGGFVWLFGSRNTVHIGASGVIFGLIGYLLAIGLFRRELLALVVSLIVSFYYGWTLLSLLMVLPGVSWSGHFFGFLSGVLAAWVTREDNVSTSRRRSG